MAIRSISWSPGRRDDAARMLSFATSPMGSLCGVDAEWSRVLRTLGIGSTTLLFERDPIADPLQEAQRFAEAVVAGDDGPRLQKATILQADEAMIRMRTPGNVTLDLGAETVGNNGQARRVLTCKVHINRASRQLAGEILGMLIVIAGVDFPIAWEDDKGEEKSGPIWKAVCDIGPPEGRLHT